ncbi:MAG: HPr family phosphocarrier protein [bacterium]
MNTVQKTFVIPNKLGLHARAAAQLVKAANRYAAEITLSTKKQSVNAKSIMGVLMLAASKGTKVNVKVEGKDAEEALGAIEELINNKFGEE